jgi:16S rRNA (cytosine967-C5)-methyltransferase
MEVIYAENGRAGIEMLQADARAVENIQADAVLVDAPCSGLGVIRRKPDIKWNRTEKDVVEHYPPLQKELLAHAAQLVKPGGRIVYSTCTIEPEENEEVVKAFLESHPAFRLEKPSVDAALLSSDGNWFQPRPHMHNMDGFFAAYLRKTYQENI